MWPQTLGAVVATNICRSLNFHGPDPDFGVEDHPKEFERKCCGSCNETSLFVVRFGNFSCCAWGDGMGVFTGWLHSARARRVRHFHSNCHSNSASLTASPHRPHKQNVAYLVLPASPAVRMFCSQSTDATMCATTILSGLLESLQTWSSELGYLSLPRLCELRGGIHGLLLLASTAIRNLEQL